MKLFKFTLVLLLTVYSLRFKSIESAADFCHFKVLKCVVSDQFVHPNFSCFAKSFSRNLSTVSYYLKFKSPIVKLHAWKNYRTRLRKNIKFFIFQAEGILQFKYGTIYRQALTFPPLELCQFMKSPDKNDKLATAIFKIGHFFPQCPFDVRAT